MTAVPPRPAAPDATAGDGLREAMARELASIDGGAVAAGSWWAYLPDADRLLALPALRDVLAAAARDAEAIKWVREIHLSDEFGYPFCIECESAYPCATIRALDAKALDPS